MLVSVPFAAVKNEILKSEGKIRQGLLMLEFVAASLLVALYLPDFAFLLLLLFTSFS